MRDSRESISKPSKSYLVFDGAISDGRTLIGARAHGTRHRRGRVSRNTKACRAPLRPRAFFIFVRDEGSCDACPAAPRVRKFCETMSAWRLRRAGTLLPTPKTKN